MRRRIIAARSALLSRGAQARDRSGSSALVAGSLRRLEQPQLDIGCRRTARPTASSNSSTAAGSTPAGATLPDSTGPLAEGPATPSRAGAEARSVEDLHGHDRDELRHIRVHARRQGARRRPPRPSTALVKRGFFDGLTFHRVAAGFVIQGGDPNGDGSGGPGYSVVEAPPHSTQYVQGDVAMAKTQSDPPGASGSQFFVVTAANATQSAGLTPDYALAGKVVSGLDVVKAIGVTADEPAGRRHAVTRGRDVEGDGQSLVAARRRSKPRSRPRREPALRSARLLEQRRLRVRRRRREALRAVVAGVVDRRPDRLQRGVRGCECRPASRRGGRGAVASESQSASASGARMIGIRSCSGAIAEFAAVVRIVQVRSVPPSGACQIDHRPANANRRSVARVMWNGCFGPPVDAAPFVEAVGDDQAAVALERAPESGALGDRLDPRVDHLQPGLGLLRPRRDQPPAQRTRRAERPRGRW